jgi:hypothetical protein
MKTRTRYLIAIAIFCLGILLAFYLCSCSTQRSYVQAPSTAKVQANVTAATQSNAQLHDLSSEEREIDRRKDNKDQIISRWNQLHPKHDN